MGKLVWSELGRLLAMVSATYMVWGSLWGLAYRKFFWDMIPGSWSRPFKVITVDVPILPIANIVLSLVTLAMEWPLPIMKGMINTQLKIVLYLLGGLLGMMVYQTVDCAVYYMFTAGVYARSLANGETSNGRSVRAKEPNGV